MQTLEMMMGFFAWPPTLEQFFVGGICALSLFALSFMIGAMAGWFAVSLFEKWKGE